MNSTLTKITKLSIRADLVCVICGNARTKVCYCYSYGNQQSSEILQCVDCGHMFVHPVPLVELNDRNMDSISDAEFFGNAWMKWLHEYFVINGEIRWIKKFLSSREEDPRLLDIGCGTGWTTSLFQKNGFMTVGLESSLTRSQAARNFYYLNVFNDHLEHFKTEELFDVIVMRHVLEHIEDPVAMLKKVKAFLKSDGILLIVLPNIHCIGRYLFKENWEWVLPWHLHFYNPKTLSQLLEKVGFKKLKVYQMPSPLWYPHTINKALFCLNQKFQLPFAVTRKLSAV